MIDRLTWRAGFIAAAILAALLFVGFATQTIRIEGFNVWPIKHEGFKAKLARVRHDLQSIKDATEIADAKWNAKVAQHEADNRAAIQEARNEERSKAMRAAADAFADRNRVRPQAAQGQPNRAGSPQADPATGNDGPGADPDMVAVPRKDFDTLTDNTIRLDKVQRQGCALIEAGLAVLENGATKCD